MRFKEDTFGSLYAEPVRNGLTRPTAVRGEGYPMVNMGELFAYDHIADQPMERVQLNHRELQVATLEPGDLLFARSSLTPEGVGKCSIVASLPEVTTFESHLIRARLDRSRADSRFYFYFFHSYYGRAAVQSIAKQVGAAGLPGSKLAGLLVPRPAATEQARIADVLAAYDDLIDNNRRRIKLLEDSVRLLFDEWFARRQLPPSLESRHDEQPLHLAVADLCIEVKTQVLPEAIDGDTPYIGLEHMPRRSITLSDWGSATDVTSAKLRYAEGDVIFGKIRPYFHKVGIALTDGVCSSDAIVMRPRAESWRPLLLGLVSSDAFIAATAQGMKEGSKMPRADWKQMRAYSVCVPNARVLGAFNGVVEPVLQQVKTLSLQARALRTARDLLLPRLMSGELTVCRPSSYACHAPAAR
ncbi:hypothetical protein [Rhodoferax sp.]|uniref:restriction endonuclease subunit S n=1 Tax=Rhodoferax sp. TaxID=50421 RepID=UPI00277040AD|nr:hypothetical protein [Rhodoferax sp.]